MFIFKKEYFWGVSNASCLYESETKMAPLLKANVFLLQENLPMFFDYSFVLRVIQTLKLY